MSKKISAAQGVRELVEENERLQRQYDNLAEHMIYDGNSISWTASKAKRYGKELLSAWDALKAIGVPCDGNTSVAEAISKFCALKEASEARSPRRSRLILKS